MVAFAAEKVLGTTVVNFNGHEINLAPPWRRVDMRQAILEAIDIDIELNPTAESLQAALEARQIKHKPGMTRGKLIDALIGDFLEPNFIQPTFLCNYPRDISPLAKSIPGNPSVVERFEGFVGGMELCNAFTELNNPLDQEQPLLKWVVPMLMTMKNSIPWMMTLSTPSAMACPLLAVLGSGRSAGNAIHRATQHPGSDPVSAPAQPGC